MFGNTRKYNSDTSLTESILYRKKDKLSQRWVYEYYSKGKRSKTTLYNKKGEVKGVWSYDCKDEGEELIKKKNETQICKWDESTKDHLIKVSQEFNEKGEIRKSVQKYTLDTLILEYAMYNENGTLLSKNTYDKNVKKPLSIIRYKKGKIISESNSKYEDDKLIYFEHFFKNKQFSTLTYKFEDGKLVLLEKTLKSKNAGATSFKYENSLLVETSRVDKKGKLVSSTKLKYGNKYAYK